MVDPVINFLGEFASSKQLIGGGKMRKSAAFLMVLCFLAFGVTATVAIGANPHDTDGSGYRVWLGL